MQLFHQSLDRLWNQQRPWLLLSENFPECHPNTACRKNLFCECIESFATEKKVFARESTWVLFQFSSYKFAIPIHSITPYLVSSSFKTYANPHTLLTPTLCFIASVIFYIKWASLPDGSKNLEEQQNEHNCNRKALRNTDAREREAFENTRCIHAHIYT